GKSEGSFLIVVHFSKKESLDGASPSRDLVNVVELVVAGASSWMLGSLWSSLAVCYMGWPPVASLSLMLSWCSSLSAMSYVCCGWLPLSGLPLTVVVLLLHAYAGVVELPSFIAAGLLLLPVSLACVLVTSWISLAAKWPAGLLVGLTVSSCYLGSAVYIVLDVVVLGVAALVPFPNATDLNLTIVFPLLDWMSLLELLLPLCRALTVACRDLCVVLDQLL
ncbi:hypothetical protein H0E87_026775, partial [Populus deltoides]